MTYIKIYYYNTAPRSQADIGRVSMLSLSSTLSIAPSGKPSRRQIAMRTLALRLMLYPASEIINNIFRIADSATGNINYGLNILHAIINGLLGTFFFFIFLSMQPKARILLYNMKYNFCFPTIWGDKSKGTDDGQQINSHQVSWAPRGVNNDLNKPLSSSTPLLADMDEDELASEIQNGNNNVDDDNDVMRGSVRESVRESEMNRSSIQGSTYGPMGNINRITTNFVKEDPSINRITNNL